MTPIHPLTETLRPMRLHVLIEANEEGGYTSQCVEIPAAVAEGATRDEALVNARRAIEAIIETRRAEARAIVEQAAGPSHRLERVDVDGAPEWMRP